jgi:hypothetical protein
VPRRGEAQRQPAQGVRVGRVPEAGHCRSDRKETASGGCMRGFRFGLRADVGEFQAVNIMIFGFLVFFFLPRPAVDPTY